MLATASARHGGARTAERLSIVGRARRVSAAEEPDARARYLARHPEARGLFALDFSLYVIAVVEAQFVGGFGSAGWLEGEALRARDRSEDPPPGH